MPDPTDTTATTRSYDIPVSVLLKVDVEPDGTLRATWAGVAVPDELGDTFDPGALNYPPDPRDDAAQQLSDAWTHYVDTDELEPMVTAVAWLRRTFRIELEPEAT